MRYGRAMRMLASPLVLASLIVCVAGCGDEANAVRGAWNIQRLTVGVAENLTCAGVDEAQSNDAGTMTFDDVPHPDGIAAHTFTYSITQVRDEDSAEMVAAERPLAGSAGWEPDDAKEDTAGFIVNDPVNASMSGLWNILESAIGAVNVEHLFPETLSSPPREQCTRSEYFLVSQ